METNQSYYKQILDSTLQKLSDELLPEQLQQLANSAVKLKKIDETKVYGTFWSVSPQIGDIGKFPGFSRSQQKLSRSDPIPRIKFKCFLSYTNKGDKVIHICLKKGKKKINIYVDLETPGMNINKKPEKSSHVVVSHQSGL